MKFLKNNGQRSYAVNPELDFERMGAGVSPSLWQREDRRDSKCRATAAPSNPPCPSFSKGGHLNSNLSEKFLNRTLTPKTIKSEQGFTLIELIIVIVIAGLVSTYFVANYEGSLFTVQYETMLQKISADVRYARDLALSNGQSVYVHIDPSNNRYSLNWADGSYIKNPYGGEDFIIRLGVAEFSNVALTGTAFSGGRLDFDTFGKPFNAGNDFTGTLSLVSVNGQKQILVSANTGFLQIEEL